MPFVDPRIFFCWISVASLAACPFAPMGVASTSDGTTGAGSTTSPDDSTGTVPTSSTSEDTTGAVPGTTGTTGATGTADPTTDSGTDSSDTGVVACVTPVDAAPCTEDGQEIHQDFEDTNFRCAVDQAIEQFEEDVDCEFTCAEARALTKLDANSRGITCTLGARHLVNLTDFLDLSGNEIAEIVDFGTLTKLTRLYLDKNKLASTAGLDAALELQILVLGDNSISDLQLPSLGKLTHLSLHANQLVSLGTFPTLPALTKLELGANAMLPPSALDVLQTNATALTELQIFNTAVTDLDHLPPLSGLTILDVGNNQLTSVSGLNKFSNVKQLRLYGNLYTALGEGDMPTVLEILDVSNNLLTSEGLLDLSTHPWVTMGDTIDVQGNPFECNSDFNAAVQTFTAKQVTLVVDDPCA